MEKKFNLKKVLLIGMSYVLLAALAIGGTIAYFTSEDSDVNVMTMGNVSIAQHEFERIQNADGTYEMITTARGTGYKVQDFTQAKPLYPATGNITGWDDKVVYWDQLGNGANGYQAPLAGLNNVQDKFVLVENTGKSDAYVRTLFAFELGSVKVEEWENYVTYNYNDTHWQWTWVQEAVEIEGNNYIVAEAVYVGADGVRHSGGVLPAGEYTYNSLAQVYMKNTATNEDVKALDGNGNGTYDILVASQAVQTAGFENAGTAEFPSSPYALEESISAALYALDTAFGDINEDNHPWVEGVELPAVVADADALKSAMDAGNNSILLMDDIDSFSGKFSAPFTLNLAGHSVDSDGIGVAADTEVSGGKIVMDNTSDYIDIRPTEEGVYTFKNINFINNYKRKPGNTGTDRIEEIVKLTAMADGVKCKFVFENCIFDNASVKFAGLSDYTADIDVTFNNCTFNALMASDPVINIGNYLTGTVNIENCTFNMTCTYSNNPIIAVSNSSNTTVTVNASNNTLKADKAIAYTYDPTKGETEVDTIKLGTTNIRNYCMFDFRLLSGGYSTVNETGTILLGEVAVPSLKNN